MIPWLLVLCSSNWALSSNCNIRNNWLRVKLLTIQVHIEVPKRCPIKSNHRCWLLTVTCSDRLEDTKKIKRIMDDIFFNHVILLKDERKSWRPLSTQLAVNNVSQFSVHRHTYIYSSVEFQTEVFPWKAIFKTWLLKFPSNSDCVSSWKGQHFRHVPKQPWLPVRLFQNSVSGLKWR